MTELKKLLVEKNWHRVFEFGIILKALNGVLQLISGLLILTLSKATFLNIFIKLTHGELIEDPNDKLITFASSALQHLSTNTKTFAAIYILLHAVINIFVAIQLYREKLWAYKLAMGVILLFMTYQVYRISYTHSLTLTLITIWDAIFIGVVWHEYNYRLSKSLQDKP